MVQQVSFVGKNRLSISIQWILVILALLGIYYSPNPGPFAIGMAGFIVFVRLFFSKSSPPILLYCFVFEWVFFQTQLIDGLFKGIPLETLDFVSATKPYISVLGFVSIFAFFFGVYLVTRRIPRYTFLDFKLFFERVSIEKLLIVYLTSYVVILLMGGIMWAIPQLTQPMYVLFEFRSALFFLLFLCAFIQNRYKGVVFIIIIAESALGLFSFFSSFKEVFILSFLAYWIFFFRTSWVSKTFGVLALMVVVYFGVLWTSVKEDYRSFLNKGTGLQTVNVSRGDAYNKLGDLISGVDAERLAVSFEIFVDRFSWIGAFDAVYNYVPRVRPYEDGNLWLEGLKRTFMPRLFFPEKNALTDSKELNYYSGLGVNEKVTSISLSMICASYIDFGVWGMHIPIFLFGILMGWIYKKAFDWGRQAPIAFALVTPLIYSMQITGQSINKLLPHIVLYLIILWGIQKFLLKPFLRYIRV